MISNVHLRAVCANGQMAEIPGPRTDSCVNDFPEDSMKTSRLLPAFVTAKSLLPAVLLVVARGCARNPNVLTQPNDSARSGETVVETSLHPSNANSLRFGLLYDPNVNGGIFA